MICTNCGKEVKTGDLFCSGCGAKMEAKFSSFHMDELKWDLDGYPDEEDVKSEPSEFKWDTVVDPPRRPIGSRKPAGFVAPKEEPAEKPAPKVEEIKLEPKEKTAEEARAEIKKRVEQFADEMPSTPWEGPAWKIEKREAEERARALELEGDIEITEAELFGSMPPKPARSSRPFGAIDFSDPKGPSIQHKDMTSTMRMDDEKRRKIRSATEKKDDDFQYGSSIFSTSRGMEEDDMPKFTGARNEADEELTSADFILPLSSGSIFYTGPNPDELAARATSADLKAAAEAYAEVEGDVADDFDKLSEPQIEPVEEPVREKRRPSYESTNTFVLEKVDINDAIQKSNDYQDEVYEDLEGEYYPEDAQFVEDYPETESYEEEYVPPVEKKKRPKAEGGITSFLSGEDVDIFLEPKRKLASGAGKGAGALTGFFAGLLGGEDEGEMPAPRRRSEPVEERVPVYSDDQEEKSGGLLDKLRGKIFSQDDESADDIARYDRRNDYDDYGDIRESYSESLGDLTEKSMASRETGSISVEDFNKDAEAAEASVIAEPSFSHRTEAERFYTFNQKSAEFQALLDQEYQRLVSRIKEESDDDTVLSQLEYMRKAETKRTKEEEEAKLEELKQLDLPEFRIVEEGEEDVEEAIEVAEEIVETVEPEVIEEVEEAAVEEPAVEEPEVDEPEVVEAVSTDEVVVDEVEIAEAEAAEEPAEKTRAELLAEIFNNDEDEAPAAEKKDDELDEFARRLHELQEEVETITEPTAPSYAYARAIPTNVIESEAERNPKAAKEAQVEVAEAEVEKEEEAKRRSTTMELSRDAYEPPVVVLEEDASENIDDVDIEVEDLDQIDFVDEDAEEAENKGSGKGITYMDIFGDAEEEARRDKEERSGRIKILLLDILIVILAICVVIAGILALAEDSAVAQKIKSILHIGTTTEEPAETENEGEAGEEEAEPEEPETQASQVTTAIIGGAVRNTNIGEIAEDTALLFSDDKAYNMEGVDKAGTFTDSDWYTGGDGNNVTYLNALIGTVIEYYSKLVDRYNEGGEAVLDLVNPDSELFTDLKENLPEVGEDGNNVRHEITKLQIGEIRQDGDMFYMLVRVAQTVSSQEDPLIEIKLVRLNTASDKVVVEEIVNVQ